MKSILMTIRNLLTNNLLFKVISLIFAAVIWIAVVNVNDPTKTVTIYNVPITILDEAVITDNNQVYTVEDKLSVNVTVTGRRSVVSDLSEDTFTATASLTQLSTTNAVPVIIKVRKNVANKISIDNQSRTSITVDVEELVKKSYPIETNVIGTVAENYSIGVINVNKKIVEITAPETVHERIAQVRVDVDITGAKENIDNKLAIKVFDANNERIKKSDTLSISLSANKTKVTAIVNKLKRVPIVYELEGEPTGGFEVTEHLIDPDEVTISGQPSDVDQVESIVITGDMLNVSDLKENKEVDINLVDYIGPGITIVGDGIAHLTINVEGDKYRNYNIQADNIKVINIPSGYTAKISASQVQLTLYGKEEYINKVTKAGLEPTVDAKSMKEGDNEAEVEFILPTNVNQSGKINVKVVLEKKEDTTKKED